jgi:hypothetical protein
MTEELKNKAEDLIYNATKGVLSAVPLGPIVAGFYESIFTPPYIKRLKKWVESLDRSIIALQQQSEEFKPENLNNNETFNTAMFHATQMAVRTHQEEKLNALRAAVLNSASPNAPEDDLQLMFLNWIDELTACHLRILKFFDSPENWVNKHGMEIPDWPKASPLRVFFRAYPKMEDRKQILNLMLQDLGDIKELMNDDKIRSEMQKMAYLRVSHTTNLGKQFLKFITSSIEDKG